MWSEAELRAALLQVAQIGAATCAMLFILDVGVTLVRRRGAAPARLAAALERRSPAPVRHLAELVVTALLTIGATRPATASTTPIRDWVNQTATTATALVVPSTSTTVRPATTTTTGAAPATTSVPEPLPAGPPAPVAPPRVPPLPQPPSITPAHTPTSYVVQDGDCLWRIAARQLMPGATNAAIDAAWRAIYALNKTAIGDNPSLIHPGLTLTFPPLSATP
jgi:nucleoid-associated protein YgaU